jgi:hypothetical protein
MANLSALTRRALAVSILGAAVAVAPAAHLLAPPASSSSPLAACSSGEEEDQFTTTCTPFLVPNSPDGFTTTAANPDIPEIDGVPCTGRDSGTCIGLAEEQEDEGPQPVPRSTISSSP